MRGQVRIIGGSWRGRKLTLAEVPGVRPTPDRVRETLFNWLAPYLPGARCLDLFSGSGALGFEALSRGASYVLMIDESYQVVKALRDHLVQFKAENAEVMNGTIPRDWPKATQPFDIVFLDPPYKADLLLPVAFLLEEKKCLSDSALIYLESDTVIENDSLPPTWNLLKSKKAGQVHYYLAERKGTPHEKAHSNT